MSVTLFSDLRRAFRTQLLTYERARVEGTLTLTAPDTITGADFSALVPGEDIVLDGFGTGRDGYATVVEGAAASLTFRRETAVSASSPAGAGRSVAAALPEKRVWEGFRSEPKANRAWLRDKLAPQMSDPRSIDPSQRLIRHEGLYFLDLFSPLHVGSAAAELMADFILQDMFHAGSRVSYNGQSVAILKAERGPGQSDSAFFQIPCTIKWRTDTFTP